MKYLVTGGAGFIGSHIVERLLKDGHDVRVLDNFSSGREENLGFVTQYAVRSAQSEGLKSGNAQYAVRGTQFELITGDIRHFPTCLDASKGVDAILHQAALRSVPKSLEIPHEYNAVNIDGTVNILEAARQNKVKRVVIASSSSVYGDAISFPQKESDTPLLISPYALTKLTGEYYSRIYSENYGLETVNLRYFNVFGPRQSLDDEYAVVIPKFITCMLNDEQPPIHGDGTQSRDFAYIDNVVQANLLAATASSGAVSDRHCEDCEPKAKQDEAISAKTGDSAIDNGLRSRNVHSPQYAVRSSNKAFCEVLNVACGTDNSIIGLVESLNKIMGKNIKPKFTPKRQGDVMRTLADVTKIRQVLGYEPKVSFEEGLKKTVESFQKPR